MAASPFPRQAPYANRSKRGRIRFPGLRMPYSTAAEMGGASFGRCAEQTSLSMLSILARSALKKELTTFKVAPEPECLDRARLRVYHSIRMNGLIV